MKARHSLWAYALMSMMAALVVVTGFASKALSDCQSPITETDDGCLVSGTEDYVRVVSGGTDDNSCATACSGVCANNTCPDTGNCAFDHGACFQSGVPCKCLCGCPNSTSSCGLSSGCS
jgi:hypothetical protein